MNRFYADPERSDQNCFVLNTEDAHHALRVLRLHAGDQAEIISEGGRYLAVLDSSDSENVCFHPVQELPSTETSISFTLFQGLPKGDKMDWVVQKAVELGVIRIVPVAFSRCIVKLSDKESEKKRERWQKIAREAGKQCGRCIIPEVCLPVFPDALDSYFCKCERVAVPWEEYTGGGPSAFSRQYPSLRSIGIVIGPEGGISSEEIAVLTQMGCEPISLGKRIFRTETAGLAAVSAFLGLYGEMEK